MYDKALLGAVGAAGASYATYKLMFPWLALDSKDIATQEKIMENFRAQADKKFYIIEAFETLADEQPDKYFLIYNDRLYTYSKVNEEANKIARVVRKWNLQKGDVVAMIMKNEPAFVWTLLGLQKLGYAISLINHNLTHKPLAHCINVCEAKAVICSGDSGIITAVQEVWDDIGNIPAYVHDVPSADLPPSFTSLKLLVSEESGENTDKRWRSALEPFDPLLYIYTSGTTGLPKPALLTQLKGVGFLSVVKEHVALTSDDIMYTCLPLYHSSALFLGLFSIIGCGGTSVIARTFSASRFWQDCRKHRVTGIQYIGELCRYLLARPQDPRDGQHCIRFAYGNGLRRDIWDAFQTRFKIPHIFEFFGATEGPVGFINLHNKTGAVGRYSPYMKWRDEFQKLFVKFDLETAQPLRDQNGRCIQVKLGEPGLLICAFPPYVKIETLYKGDPKLVEKKLVRNVLKDGDVFFNFGDILYQDKDYFIYFADRIGDTFRWKGENVSTLEVANVLSRLDWILDANVYGVTVPGNDGRAGMASLLLKDGSSELTEERRKTIFEHCSINLPKYARPLFLRVQPEMALTSTHKQRKVELVKEGFDVTKIEHALYFLDSVAMNYVPLSEQVYFRLMTGNSKL